jgi:hypothetical protein
LIETGRQESTERNRNKASQYLDDLMADSCPLFAVSAAAPLSITLRVTAQDLGSLADDQLRELSCALESIQRLPFARMLIIDVSHVRNLGARFLGIIAAHAALWRLEGRRLCVSGDQCGVFAAVGLKSLLVAHQPATQRRSSDLSQSSPFETVVNA